MKNDIQRLTDRLRRLEDENSEYCSRTKSLSTEYESIKQRQNMYENDLSLSKRENDDLKKRIAENGTLLNEYSHKFPYIESEVDRLQLIINKKDEKIKGLEDIIRFRDEEINKFRVTVS